MNQKELREKLEEARKVGKKAWKQAIEEAEKLHPTAALIYFHKGEYAMERWARKEALTYLDKALQKEPGNTLYKARLAHALTQSGEDKERALSLLQELLTAAPENKAYHFQLASYYLYQQEAEKAISHLSRILELDPMHREARAMRAKAYGNENKSEQALADIGFLLEHFPREDAYWQLKAQELSKSSNRLEEAVAALRKAVALNPNNTVARANIANYYFNARAYEKAIAAYTEHIEETGETERLYQDRADCFIPLKQYKEALADLDKAAELGAENGNFHLRRGEAQFGLGNYAAAAKELEVALEKDCWQEGSTRLMLGKAYLKQNALEKAAAMFELAKDGFMCRSDAHYFLGNTRAKQGDMTKAIANWQIAAEDHHAEAQQKLAEQLEKAKSGADNSDFAGAAQKNKNVPFLQRLFGKTWAVDIAATKSSSAQLNAMPASMVDVFMEMFKGITITLTPEVLKLNNVMGTDVEAVYRVEKEGENHIELYGQPQGQDARKIKLERKDSQLIFNMEANGQPLQLWLREAQAEDAASSVDLEETLGALMSGLGEALGNLTEKKNPLDEKEESEEGDSSSLGDKLASGLNAVLQEAMNQQSKEEKGANPNLQIVDAGPKLQDVLFDTWRLDPDMTLAHGLPFKNFPAVMHHKLRKQFEEALLTVAENRLEMKGGGETTRGNWEAIEQADYFLKAKGYRDGDDAPANFEFSLLPQHLRMKMQTEKEQQPTIFFFKRS